MILIDSCQELNYESKDCRDNIKPDIYNQHCSICCLLLHCSSRHLGLYLAATTIGQEIGLSNALTLLEPLLARDLRSFGSNCCPLWKLVEFHGQRRLFLWSLATVLNSMNASTYQRFQLFHSQVKKSLLYRHPNLLDYKTAEQYKYLEPKTGNAQLYNGLKLVRADYVV